MAAIADTVITVSFDVSEEKKSDTLTNHIKILSQTDEHITIGGKGVIFGGKDLEQDTFTKNTNLHLDLVPNKPVFYDHSLEATLKSTVLGVVTKTEIKSDHLWVEAQLKRSADYMEEVLKLIEAGVLGWSSGSVPHLVRRDENKNITDWPIIELSLTPTPAEFRTIGIERIKQLSNLQPNLKELLETAQDTVSDSTVLVDDDINNDLLDNTEEENIMSDLDIKAIVTDAVNTAVTATEERLTKAFDAQMSKPQSKTSVVKTADLTPEVKGVELIGAFLKHGNDHAVTRQLGSGMKVITVGTPATVGLTVPEDWFESVFTPKTEGELTTQLGFDIANVPGAQPIHYVSASAITPAVLTTECDPFTEKEPTVTEQLLSPNKYTCFTDASQEILNDSFLNIGNWLATRASEGFKLARNTNAVTIVQTAPVGHTTALPTAFTFDDLYELFFSVPHQYRNMGSQKWLMNDATMQFITTLEDNEARKYINFNPAEAIAMTIFGREVIISNEMDDATAGLQPIAFGNFNSIIWRNWNQVEFLRNPYSLDTTGKIRFTWWARWNGLLPTGDADSIQLMEMAP